MQYLVGVANHQTSKTLTGRVDARSPFHAVLSVARFLGLSPAAALRVTNAGDSWAVQLWREGYWFSVAVPE